MNHEFYQIMVGAPTMSLYSWKQLARWSIEYSCLKPEDVTKGLEILDESWRTFCKDVVDKYDAALMDGDKIDVERAQLFYSKQLKSPQDGGLAQPGSPREH